MTELEMAELMEQLQQKPKHKKLEFTQKLLLTMITVSIIFTAFSYVLAFIGKDTVEALSSEIVRTVWLCDGVGVLGYAMQNMSRAKWHKDKTANDVKKE